MRKTRHNHAKHIVFYWSNFDIVHRVHRLEAFVQSGQVQVAIKSLINVMLCLLKGNNDFAESSLDYSFKMRHTFVMEMSHSNCLRVWREGCSPMLVWFLASVARGCSNGCGCAEVAEGANQLPVLLQDCCRVTNQNTRIWSCDHD